MMNKSELIEKIKLAFSDVEYPGNENLVKESYGEEAALVRNHFLGQKDWKKLSPEFMDLDGALSFLSDQALLFYIPAFLIADVNEELNYNDPAVRLCYALSPQSQNIKIAKIYGAGTLGERAKKCFDTFSKEQVSAIVSYLQWKLSQDEFNLTIQQALENYWLAREKS